MDDWRSTIHAQPAQIAHEPQHRRRLVFFPVYICAFTAEDTEIDALAKYF
jgi:hypothetical protein